MWLLDSEKVQMWVPLILLTSFLSSILNFVYMEYTCHGICVKATGHLVGVDYLLPWCGFWKLNSNYQAWCQAPFSCRIVFMARFFFLSYNWSLLPTQIISIPIPLPLDCLLHNWLHFCSLLCWNRSLNVMWLRDWGVFWDRDLAAPAIVQCLFFIPRKCSHDNTLSFHERVSHPVTIILPGNISTFKYSNHLLSSISDVRIRTNQRFICWHSVLPSLGSLRVREPSTKMADSCRAWWVPGAGWEHSQTTDLGSLSARR